MKSFKFSLQSVRTLRERQEQAALHEHAAAEGVRQRAADKLAGAERNLAAAWDEFQQLSASGCTALELTQHRDHCAVLERRRGQCVQELQQIEKLVQAAFNKLVEARKASAVIEKLFEAQRQEFLHERRKHEQKMLDELSRRAAPRPGSHLADELEPILN